MPCFLSNFRSKRLARFGTAAALDQDLEYGTVLVDGPPQPMLLAGDVDHDFIKVPFVSWCGQTSADPVGITLAELQRSLSHGLVAHKDASGGQYLLDHAQAQGKPEVQPDGMADHLSRKAMADITRITGVLHRSRIPRSSHPSVNLTMPSADRGESHDPTGDISRTNGKGHSKGLTRIPGIREQCRLVRLSARRRACSENDEGQSCKMVGLVHDARGRKARRSLPQ